MERQIFYHLGRQLQPTESQTPIWKLRQSTFADVAGLREDFSSGTKSREVRRSIGNKICKKNIRKTKIKTSKSVKR